MSLQPSQRENPSTSFPITLFFSIGTLLLFYTFNQYLYLDQAGDGFLNLHNYHWTGSFSTDWATGLDGLAVLFLLLTAFIFPPCYLLSRSIAAVANYYLFILFLLFLFLMEILLFAVFQLLDLFFFYFCFEAVLIPMFMLIGQWGSRERRITAAYYFFLYTLVTSMCIFVSVFYIFSTLGSTLYPLLADHPFSITEETYLAIAFFITFATKIPMVPFHIWLPEAHVEAPTVGSVILASLLLKLGGFGFLRYSLSLFTTANRALIGLIYILALLGVLYASLTTIRQIDLKRIIAYSSVAHMNLAVLGMFAFTQQGLDGSVYLMLGHGIVSGALFMCIGVLYDRYHTRLLHYYSGLVTVMPLFACAFFVFTAANMGFPGTVNFVAEFLIYTGIFDHNAFIAILAAPAIVLSAVYSIWLYNRVIFGTLETRYLHQFNDLFRTEASILLVLVLGTLYFGLTTTDILDPVYNSTKWILVQ